MTVQQVLMKPGRWSLRFRELDASFKVLNQISWFDSIVITPTRLDNVKGYGDAAILARSMYTGVVLDRTSTWEIAGSDLSYVLGADTGEGEIAINSPISNVAGTLDDWLSDILPVNGINKGTVTNTGLTLTYDAQFITRRELLDFVCKNLSAMWRMNPDGTIDAAAAATLFLAAPTVVITRQPEGSEGGKKGLEAVDMRRNSTVRGYAHTIGLVGRSGDGDDIPVATSTGTSLFLNFRNGALVMERLASAPDLPAAALAAYADALRIAANRIQYGVVLSSATYSVPRFTKPGDLIYVYDRLAGLVDTANQLNWRGDNINPILLRALTLEWSIEDGQGVYLRHPNGSGYDYTDLTDMVEWETGPSTWEVGQWDADPNNDPSQSGAGYLGINGQILDRSTMGKKFTFLPTWSGTIGNGTITGTYVRIGDLIEFWIDIVWGSTTSHAAASQFFTLPFPADRSYGSIGEGRLEDNGVARYERVCSLTSTTQFYMETEAGVLVSNTVPWTMGNLDKETAHGRYFAA